jgi:hypothetical protein
LPLDNTVSSLGSTCFLACYTIRPSDPLPLPSNGRETRLFVPITAKGEEIFKYKLFSSLEGTEDKTREAASYNHIG